jgi:hypothetical protein
LFRETFQLPSQSILTGSTTFFIHDETSSTLAKPSGWLSLKTMEDEINHILSRPESKFCTPNGGTCTSKTIGLLVRRHIQAGEFHYIGREVSTRWASGPDLSMMAEAGVLDPTHETFREYERVVDAKYLEEIRAEAKQFSTKLLSRKSGVAECAIRNFKPPAEEPRHTYGTTIAHGFLTLALVSYFMKEAISIQAGVRMAVNYGLNRVRLPAPVLAESCPHHPSGIERVARSC